MYIVSSSLMPQMEPFEGAIYQRIWLTKNHTFFKLKISHINTNALDIV